MKNEAQIKNAKSETKIIELAKENSELKIELARTKKQLQKAENSIWNLIKADKYACDYNG